MADSSNSVTLTWTPANWITIILMVLIPYFLFAAAVKAVAERKAAA